MSIDPLAAGVADLAALVDVEIAALAADAQALRAQLVQDAVVTARVLSSNGLTDLLEIAGRRVAASLPPNLQPGDAVAVQVTGFDGDRIVLKVVGDAPEVPPGAPEPPGPPVPVARAAPQIAPPAPSFVRAAVVPAPSDASAAAQPAAPQAAGSRAAAVPEGHDPIEIRLAAARAAVAATPVQPRPPAEAVPTARFVIAPPIAPRAVVPPAGSPLATPVTHGPPPSAPAAVSRAAGLTAYTEPVALLRALKLPVTPTNVASATIALAHPERLPVALQALERALPRASAEPQVATLRTLLAFVGRIDPRSPVLAAQIAAYVDHVVAGAEPKLATLLAAHAAPPDVEPGAAPAPAVAAERRVALGFDLKQTILAVAADAATPRAAAPSLAGALAALTAVQVGAAQTLAANPGGIAFALPLVTEHGTVRARISVGRERSGTRRCVDGDDFRIAFVLETAHYGTVAIDLVTVGRDVTVDVRAASAPAMRAFRDALGGLTARLEALRYRVASAEATVGVTTTVARSAPPAIDAGPRAAIDRSA